MKQTAVVQYLFVVVMAFFCASIFGGEMFSDSISGLITLSYIAGILECSNKPFKKN